MWNYEKRLQYPVNISTPNPKIAQVILTQFGGPDGELSASMRYLAQRYTMPYRNVAGLLTDIGREASEMFHLRGPSFPPPRLLIFDHRFCMLYIKFLDYVNRSKTCNLYLHAFKFSRSLEHTHP